MKHTPLFCVLALAAFSHAQAAVTYSYEGPVGRVYGYYQGQVEEGPYELYQAGPIFGRITLDTDPSAITRQDTEEQHKLTFSNVSVTVNFQNSPVFPFPLQFSNAAATFEDNFYDHDWFSINATYIAPEYRASFYFRFSDDGFGSFRSEPLTLPALEAFSNPGQPWLSVDYIKNDGSGWGITNNGYSVEIATAPVPLPGAFWLFLSAGSVAIPRLIRKRI